jgi:preprotein translocase subunit YajC
LLDTLLNHAAAVLAQAPAAGSAAKPADGGMNLIFPIVVIMGLFYFMILRPQNKDKQRVADMRSSIKKGDKIRSIGGIYGTVTAVDTNKNTVKVKVDKNVEIEFDKDAIATITREEEPAAASSAADASAK